MAKTKAQDVVVIHDLDEADAKLGEIGRERRRLATLEAELNEAIDRLKAEHAAQAAPIKARIKALEGGLLGFADYHGPELFTEGRRSRQVTFGTFGWRKATSLKPKPKTRWADVLQRLQELNFREAIRVKESPDKEVLRQWPEDRLDLVGCRLVDKDEFYYEVDEAKLDDAR